MGSISMVTGDNEGVCPRTLNSAVPDSPLTQPGRDVLEILFIVDGESNMSCLVLILPNFSSGV